MDPIRVLFVDDEKSLQNAWQKLLLAQADMECVGVRDTADGLLDVVRETQATVVLIDLTMPGREPLEAVAELAESCPECRVIVYSGYSDTDSVHSAIDAGAWGFVDKAERPTEILAAIRKVATGDAVFPQR